MFLLGGIQHSTLNIQHSSSVRIGARQGEANGVWWLPRSSKPLFRRGSVEGLVRFRRASAIYAGWDVRRLGWELGRAGHPNRLTAQHPNYFAGASVKNPTFTAPPSCAASM